MENNEQNQDSLPSANSQQSQDGFASSGTQQNQDGYTSSGYQQNQDGYTSGGYQQNQGGYTSSGYQQNQNGYTSGGYQQPMFNNQPQKGGDQGFAIAGMVLGIVSIVCCCCSWLSAIAAVAGLAFSIISIVQKKPGKGMAIAGIVCSSIGLIILILVLVANAYFYTNEPVDVERIFEEFNIIPGNNGTVEFFEEID